MSNDNLGPGVSRVLDPTSTQYDLVVWQADKPPLDSELNLLQQLATQGLAQSHHVNTPSGWLSNSTNPSDVYETNPLWSNWFKFGHQGSGEKRAIPWAVVNGWYIPVTATQTGTPPGSADNTATWNRVTLDPPPLNAGDKRVDFIFLEAWRARVPTGVAASKPEAASVYRFGNVEGGTSYLPDDLQDPEIGVETTQRVQVQYRLRVVTGLLGLAAYPDGFDITKVFARGLAAVPGSYTFANMRQELGDPGLWRAGDGSLPAQTALGTVDGYTYAIPLAFIFRRNGVAWNGDPFANLNGGVNRNPTATSRAGFKTFSAMPTLATDLSSTSLSSTLSAYTANTLPLPATPTSPVLLKIGDELVTYQTVSGTTLTLVARGVNGTRAETHKAGTPVEIVPGRPDGYFADQIAATDILDARHVVSPQGFDYNALLRGALGKLLRGDLQANWKSADQTQGPWLLYQDKVTDGAVALGVTKLDGPNLVRRVWSDASTLETVDTHVTPSPGIVPGPGAVQIATPWSLSLPAETTFQSVPNEFNSGDIIRIQPNAFQQGLGADTDQVRFVNDGLAGAVQVRIRGQSFSIDPIFITVTPLNPNPGDPLVITFVGSGIYPIAGDVAITVRVLYGPGRGTSRKFDSVHSLAMLTNAGGEYLLAGPTVPASNVPLRAAWLPLWSRFRNNLFAGQWPTTAEAYADASSKTVAIQPFRRITFPQAVTQDGNAVNGYGNVTYVGANATTNGSDTLSKVDGTFAGFLVGFALVITSGPAKGRYTVTAVPNPLQVQVEGILPSTLPLGIPVSAFHFEDARGIMPTVDSNLLPKWVTTDPLGLFAGSVIGPLNNAFQRNLYVTLPRHLVPGWGDILSPVMLPGGSVVFDEGVNFGLQSKQGSVYSDTNHNPQYINYVNAPYTNAVFSTHNLTSLPGTVAATYNAVTPSPGVAGARFYSDPTGRAGVELPPFYGVARLWAVYEAQDYLTNGSAYVSATRSPLVIGSPAQNLLRQNFEGPFFFITKDDDGDSTFVLNANALDLSKSTLVPIPTFTAGRYVIEASIFGFDRNSFNVNSDFRLVLSRNRTLANSSGPLRSANLGVTLPGVTAILPGPLAASDGVVINYSRAAYQGDAWGSETTYTDTAQRMGPLSSVDAYQLSATQLDQNALTRPYQKPLEVLASVSFQTTAGTGRLGMEASSGLNVLNIGYENPAVYPPPSPVAARPRSILGALVGITESYGTDLSACTSRLPLGGLFRDKDFRGEPVATGKSAFVVEPGETNLGLASLSPRGRQEVRELPVTPVTSCSGEAGDVIVHVDGEQSSYVPLVNYRTTRGGSLYSATLPRPGGEVSARMSQITTPVANHPNVLSVKALLVRNALTQNGFGEVSSGGELMMLIATEVHRLNVSGILTATGGVTISTNGTKEGYSAADLYRIEGRPLESDHVGLRVNPFGITLTRRALG